MHQSNECNQEIQGVVKVQHAHVEEMLGSERFGGVKRDQGTQMSPTTGSLARPSSTKDKVRLPVTRFPPFMDRIFLP